MVFLLPTAGGLNPSKMMRAFSISRLVKPECAWRDIRIGSELERPEFCSTGIRKGTKADQPSTRTLEGWCSELLDACLALAKQELPEILKDTFKGAVYIPIIVTATKLSILQFDPDQVSLDTAYVPPTSKINPVDWVHFTKNFELSLSLENFLWESKHTDKACSSSVQPHLRNSCSRQRFGKTF